MFSHNEEIALKMGYHVGKDGQAYSPRGKEVGTCGIKGYMYIGIRTSENKIIKVFIHRLQAYQKYGKNIYNANFEIRHLNGNLKDNSWSNIGIGTHKDNMLDIPKEKRRINASNASKRYSDELVQEIYEKHLKGTSYKTLMKEYHISSKGTLSFIINKRMVNKFNNRGV